MGSQAEAAIPQADAERRWPGRRTPSGIGRRADLYSLASWVGEPAGGRNRDGCSRASLEAVKPIANWLRFQGESAVREGEGAARVC